MSLRLVAKVFALTAASAATLAPTPLAAQLVDVRFVAIDMLGGAAQVSDADLGVAFGARFGFADVFGRVARLGFEMDWWSAANDAPPFEMRDIMGGIAVWKELTRGAFRPYLGVGVAVHWIDTAPIDSIGGPLPLEARELQGGRVGGSGFAGFALRLSSTGAIWFLVEYRYTVISDLPYHELRAGLRLAGSSR